MGVEHGIIRILVEPLYGKMIGFFNKGCQIKMASLKDAWDLTREEPNQYIISRVEQLRKVACSFGLASQPMAAPTARSGYRSAGISKQGSKFDNSNSMYPPDESCHGQDETQRGLLCKVH